MARTVAIVGRPNVGKSTLFNRLVGKRLALVDPTPGVTRDRREGEGRLGDLEFRVIDTAGVESTQGGDDLSLASRLRRQTEAALADADVALFLIDARAGITPPDRDVADWLRRAGKPVHVVANKCEGGGGAGGLAEAYALGLGEAIPISAEHGEGLADLFDALAPHIEVADAAPHPAATDPSLHLAIVGRPNAGKSTLVNRLLGEERMLTGPEPGLTRDSIAVAWKCQGRPVRLVDTAGMRRKSRVDRKLEKMSVAETLRSIDLAHVVVLVVDGVVGMDRQDVTIADRVLAEGRALLIAVNKWDAVEDRAAALKAIEDKLERSLAQGRGVPLLTFSALTGRHVDRLMPRVFALYDQWNRRFPTAALNRWLAAATAAHPPPAVQGRHIRIRYATQVKTRPPTIALFASRPEKMPEAYGRYLVNALREAFDLPGVPVRLVWRKGKNPFAPA